MKTKSLFFIFLISFLSTSLKAQNYNWNYSVNTHNQTSVNVGLLTSSDYNWFERWLIKTQCLNAYNGLEYISEATKTYNCHFYAWFISEQYPSLHYWLDYPENNWLDYSFVKTGSEQYPGKVTYSDSGGELYHSAITTSTSGRYISKWGSLCRFEHDYDECPYWGQGAQIRNYYSRFKISGPDELTCNSGNYTVPNTTGEGYAVDWSTNDKLSINTSDIESSNISSLNDGNGVVTASISKSGYFATHNENKTVLTFTSAPLITSPLYAGSLCSYSYTDFWFDNNNPSSTYFTWTVTGDADIYGDQGYPWVTLALHGSGYITLEVYAENWCGTSSTYSQEFFIDDCSSKMLILSPNPASDNIKIQLFEDPKQDAIVEIYNSQLMKLISTSLTSKEQSIDISRLSTGMYYLKVIYNGKIKTGKFVKK